MIKVRGHLRVGRLCENFFLFYSFKRHTINFFFFEVYTVIDVFLFSGNNFLVSIG